MEAYIPFVLEDLWELGSMPEYIIELIKKNVNTEVIRTITDFGCGKGAVLIKLASEFDFKGVGIDVVPEFIVSAQKYAQQNKVDDRICFTVGDIRKVVSSVHDQDVVIYGHDAEVLGNVQESLFQLKKCLSAQGWIILEVAYTPDNTPDIDGLPTESELNRQLNESGLKIVDKIVWDVCELKKVNDRNNKLIQSKIDELVKIHPDKAPLFRQYMHNQLQECKEMEGNMICSTWLLGK